MCVSAAFILSSLTYIDTFSDNANWLLFVLNFVFLFFHSLHSFIHQILLSVALFNIYFFYISWIGACLHGCLFCLKLSVRYITLHRYDLYLYTDNVKNVFYFWRNAQIHVCCVRQTILNWPSCSPKKENICQARVCFHMLGTGANENKHTWMK